MRSGSRFNPYAHSGHDVRGAVQQRLEARVFDRPLSDPEQRRRQQAAKATYQRARRTRADA